MGEHRVGWSILLMFPFSPGREKPSSWIASGCKIIFSGLKVFPSTFLESSGRPKPSRTTPGELVPLPSERLEITSVQNYGVRSYDIGISIHTLLSRSLCKFQRANPLFNWKVQYLPNRRRSFRLRHTLRKGGLREWFNFIPLNKRKAVSALRVLINWSQSEESKFFF